jgi:NADH dehydrogenase FAD-containing subunit
MTQKGLTMTTVGPTNLYEFLFDSTIWLLGTILNAINVVLEPLAAAAQALKSSAPSGHPKRKVRVVIVGASFAGLEVQRTLAKHSNELDITIIDYKTYFEYTPGILRCFILPSFYQKLTCPLSVLLKTGTNVISGEVASVQVEDPTKNGTKNEVTLKDGRRIPYDYLVLANGSSYPGPIKPTPSQRTTADRQRQWNDAAEELDRAQTVAIVGAGAVGVELAGEIRDKYPAGTKRVMLIDMAPTILPGLEPASIRYATKWLENHDVELYLGSPLKNIDSNSITFKEGTKVQVDIVYKCVGVAPNSNMLQSNALAKTLQGPNKSVMVNDHLQVVGYSHVFCAGDLCFHGKSNELKLAHTAELNAHLVAENIMKMVAQDFKQHESGLSADPLLVYPNDVVGNSVTPKLYCLSLGRYDATLGFNSLVINGSIGALMKWLIESMSVAAAAQRPIGNLFWMIAHYTSNLMGRTVLPSKKKNS